MGKKGQTSNLVDKTTPHIYTSMMPDSRIYTHEDAINFIKKLPGAEHKGSQSATDKDQHPILEQLQQARIIDLKNTNQPLTLIQGLALLHYLDGHNCQIITNKDNTQAIEDITNNEAAFPNLAERHQLRLNSVLDTRVVAGEVAARYAKQPKKFRRRLNKYVLRRKMGMPEQAIKTYAQAKTFLANIAEDYDGTYHLPRRKTSEKQDQLHETIMTQLKHYEVDVDKRNGTLAQSDGLYLLDFLTDTGIAHNHHLQLDQLLHKDVIQDQEKIRKYRLVAEKKYFNRSNYLAASRHKKPTQPIKSYGDAIDYLAGLDRFYKQKLTKKSRDGLTKSKREEAQAMRININTLHNRLLGDIKTDHIQPDTMLLTNHAGELLAFIEDCYDQLCDKNHFGTHENPISATEWIDTSLAQNIGFQPKQDTTETHQCNQPSKKEDTAETHQGNEPSKIQPVTGPNHTDAFTFPSFVTTPEKNGDPTHRNGRGRNPH